MTEETRASTENVTPNDIYIQHLVSMANTVNRLHDGLERVLAIEEWTQPHFLETLAAIEAWLDSVATRQERRLEYAVSLARKEGDV